MESPYDSAKFYGLEQISISNNQCLKWTNLAVMRGLVGYDIGGET
jgi:hypothetical protein